jgi:hypothetical protein
MYTLKVNPTLLTMGIVHGLKPDDMVEFFATQVPALLAAPANYNKFGELAPVRIMRGFYPGTPIFFKLVVAKNDLGVFAKASVPMTVLRKVYLVSGYLSFRGDDVSKQLTKKLENAFLDVNHTIEPLVTVPLKMPRCMSPKGVRLFTYKKPRKKRRKS